VVSSAGATAAEEPWVPDRRSAQAATRPARPAWRTLPAPPWPESAAGATESPGVAAWESQAPGRLLGSDPARAERRGGVRARRAAGESTRHPRPRPQAVAPRSLAPSPSFLPLSRLTRHRIACPSATARCGAFDATAAAEATAIARSSGCARAASLTAADPAGDDRSLDRGSELGSWMRCWYCSCLWAGWPS
jgi:hypothetical protein